jgi:hypothetical protein
VAHSFRDAGHLPKLRRGGGPAHPEGLPRQRRGTTPQMHGRYPDYDVLANAGHWDPVTREVVLDRVHRVTPVRFFDTTEARALGAFLDVVLAQDAEPRIPVLAMVDDKLHAGRLDGYRFAGMPPDPETWRLVARGLDESARAAGAEDFAAAPERVQHELVGRLAAGELSGGAWERLDVRRAWSVVMRAALAAFYSHPWAWNEIGFGGPAYPRGYMRLHAGPAGRDPHEAVEAFGMDPVTHLPDPGS